jgi:hypothetical protein
MQATSIRLRVDIAPLLMPSFGKLTTCHRRSSPGRLPIDIVLRARGVDRLPNLNLLQGDNETILRAISSTANSNSRTGSTCILHAETAERALKASLTPPSYLPSATFLTKNESESSCLRVPFHRHFFAQLPTFSSSAFSVDGSNASLDARYYWPPSVQRHCTRFILIECLFRSRF